MKFDLRRMAVKAGAVLLAAAMLAGCQASSGGTAPASSTTTAASGSAAAVEQGFTPRLDTEAEVNLEVSGFLGNFEALDQVVNAFNEYYPNVTINYEQNSGSKMAEYFRNNPYVDIVMTDDNNFRYADWTDYYVKDQVADLSAEDIDTSAVQPELLDACTFDGKLLRLPIGMNLSGMVVNKTLLEKEGLSVPTNWQEFLDVCAALKEKGYTPIQGAQTMVYSDLVYNMGMVEFGTDSTKVDALNNGDDAAVETAEAAYDRLETLLDLGYTDPAVNAEYPDDNYDGAILKFFEGDVPFWVCNSEKYSGMKKRESKSETYSASPFEYQFMYVPVGDNGAYEFVEPWFGFSINKNSDAYDYAVEFLRFLAQEEQLNTIAAVKGVPSAAQNSTDERYAAVRSGTNVEKRFVNEGTLLNHMKDYFRNSAGKLGQGELSDAHAAAEDYVANCAKTAAEMNAQ